MMATRLMPYGSILHSLVLSNCRIVRLTCGCPSSESPGDAAVGARSRLFRGSGRVLPGVSIVYGVISAVMLHHLSSLARGPHYPCPSMYRCCRVIKCQLQRFHSFNENLRATRGPAFSLHVLVVGRKAKIGHVLCDDLWCDRLH